MATIIGSGPIDGTDGDDIIVGSEDADSIRGFAGADNIQGRGGNDAIQGNGSADVIFGGDGNDQLDGGGGSDEIFGEDGDDQIVGDAGDDDIAGGSGDDLLVGRAGSDDFFFDPSNPDEGDDSIGDFEVGTDKIVLRAADILRADPDLPAADPNGDPNALEVSDFDASDNWDIVASADGDVTVVHPGGSIEFEGIPFGPSTDTFEDLAAANAVEIVGAEIGDDGDDTLSGDQNDDVLDGQGGNDTLEGNGGADILLGGDGEDTLVGGSGDDTLSGGADADDFAFNPNNPNEGTDVITDFTVGEDKIVLSITDILSADPDLPAAAGDPDALEIEDFDASDNWNVSASEDGDVTVVHPGGAFELDGIAFGDATDSFAELAALDTIELVP